MQNIIDILQWRYATKKFDPTKKIDETTLATLKEALALTPSSLGLQPWKFLIVENKTLRAKLREHSWNQSQITDASHLIVLCRPDNIDAEYVEKWINHMRKHSGRSEEALQGYQKMILNLVVNDDAPRKAHQATYMEKQIYIALGNLMTCAAALKVDTCAIGGFDAEKYDEILNLNAKGLKSCVVCPIGYRHADDPYINYKKTRWPIETLFETL